jgi:hypothetical protein
MKSPKLFVYVVIADSESGDHYGPWCFASCPTDQELKQLLMKEFEGTGAFTPGLGTWGSQLYVATPMKVLVQP